MNLLVHIEDENNYCEICDMPLGTCDCGILQDDDDDMGCLLKTGIIQMEDL